MKLIAYPMIKTLASLTRPWSRLALAKVPLLAMTLLSACAVAPTSIVQTPTTAKPQPVAASQRTEGAIFNQSGYRPLFEDRRPRYVGDIVTVLITENTAATKANDNEKSKDSSNDSSITALFGKAFPKAAVSASSSGAYKDKATADASNSFNGAITATVVDVLANGYLVVSGEKQIGLDKGTEYVRFSGVINPDSITQGNQVPSTKVADARIEYRSNTKLDAAEVLAIFSRFFLTVLP